MEQEEIKKAREWLQFTRNANIYAMARIHVKNLLDEIDVLKAEIERKDYALKKISKMVQPSSGYIKDLRVTGTIYEAVNYAVRALQGIEEVEK